MKRVTALLLLLCSLQVSADCYVNSQVTVSSPDGQTTLTSTGNYLVRNRMPLESCEGYWISTAEESRQYVDVMVTPENFARSFFFGVSTYLTFWYGPFLVRLAKQLINKL